VYPFIVMQNEVIAALVYWVHKYACTQKPLVATSGHTRLVSQKLGGYSGGYSGTIQGL